MDFCRGITPPKPGNRIKINPAPRFSTAPFYGKIGFTIVVVVVGLAGLLAPNPRPHPKNRKVVVELDTNL